MKAIETIIKDLQKEASKGAEDYALEFLKYVDENFYQGQGSNLFYETKQELMLRGKGLTREELMKKFKKSLKK